MARKDCSCKNGYLLILNGVLLVVLFLLPRILLLWQYFVSKRISKPNVLCIWDSSIFCRFRTAASAEILQVESPVNLFQMLTRSLGTREKLFRAFTVHLFQFQES